MSGHNTYTIVISDEGANDFLRRFGNEENFGSSAFPWVYVALAVADAIRANPPKPPRMDEPHWEPQVWAHTADNAGRRGFAVEPWANGAQWVDAHGVRYRWSQLDDPEPWRADA